MSDDQSTGFQLRELRLCGPGVEPAQLKFSAGLNVVEGASDTGKSYAVSCIDFVLGAKDLPEEIPQAKGYTVIYLAIETRAGKSYALKRALVGGQIGMYAGSLEAAMADDSAAWESLGVTSKATKSVSNFLLSLCGLEGRRVRRNDQGATHVLSFRVLSKSLIIDEERIIAKRSPIYGTQNTANTAAASTLRMLLTGLDDSEIVPPEDKKTAAGRLAGQKQVVEGLIQKDKALLAELTAGQDGPHMQQTIEELEAMLGQLSASVSAALSDLRAVERSRETSWIALRQARQRAAELDGLIARAALLDQHYRSDLARLETMAESAHLLRHYTEEPCQFCGADPEHHQHEQGQPPEATIEAAAAEAAKIHRLRAELKIANDQMVAELNDLVGIKMAHEAEIEAASKQIDDVLSPRMTEAATRLQDFQSEYSTQVRMREITVRIASLEEKHKALGEKPSTPEKLVFAQLTVDVMAEACRQIASLLDRWGAADAPSVSFHEKSADLLVDGRRRVSHGKGVRAVMCAAYVIGIMQHNLLDEGGHPGFVVLDTPLNPYKAADATDDGEVTSSVKDSFYRDLCETQIGQVVVFENTAPPKDVQGRCNYIHFSGSSIGRQGFIP